MKKHTQSILLLVVVFIVPVLYFSFTVLMHNYHTGTFFEASFDSDEDGFVYFDDAFENTNQPGYASGSYQSSGGYSGGALKVYLGGLDASYIYYISGGWVKTFSVTTPVKTVLSFKYNLTQSSDYESSEYSRVMVSFDGVLYGRGTDEYVDEIWGNGNGGSPISTGWQTFYADLGLLDSTDHALIIGVYNNQKTQSTEYTELLIDDVMLITCNVAPVADAGTDQYASAADVGDLAQVTLDGSGSTDFGGTIASYDWSKNGISIANGEVAVVDLGVGEHTIGLTVTDDSAAVGTDSVSVFVSSRGDAPQIVDLLDFDRFKSNIKTLSDFGGRDQSGAGSQSYLNAEAWVITQLESFGYTVNKHRFTYQGYPRDNLYVTKVGTTSPDSMYMITAHLDGIASRGGHAANDNGSGCSLVLEAARVFGLLGVQPEKSVRFIFWNNEETGLDGSEAYVSDKAGLQGIESPAGSGEYPEPVWVGLINPDMILFDHGLPVQTNQAPDADMDVDYQENSTYAEQSMRLALLLQNGSNYYSPDYPAEVRSNMSNTDSYSFRNYTAAVSLRENNRLLEIGNGSDPHWHQATDVYTTFSEDDFKLGFNTTQMAVGTVAELTGALYDPSAAVDESDAIPLEYQLEQNYPNPFNPETTIEFTLKKHSFVTMNIYNLLGQEIRTLLQQDMPAGRHQIHWNSSNNKGAPVNAGVYICRMTTENTLHVIKMILLK
ncbi:M28 family peptidase [candidate division KSB1 bacterium]